MRREEAIREVYHRHGDKLRFLVVGLWNAIFSYGLFLLALEVLSEPLGAFAGSEVRWLSQVGQHYYLVVQWFTWVPAVVQSTATMKYIAFRSGGRLWPQVGRAYLVYLPAQGLSTLLLWLTVRVLRMTPEIGQLVTIVFTVVFSYVGHKYFTFGLPLVTAGALEEPRGD